MQSLGFWVLFFLIPPLLQVPPLQIPPPLPPYPQRRGVHPTWISPGVPGPTGLDKSSPAVAKSVQVWTRESNGREQRPIQPLLHLLEDPCEDQASHLLQVCRSFKFSILPSW